MAKKKDKIGFKARSLEDFDKKSTELTSSQWLQTAAEAVKINSVKLWTGFYEFDMITYGGLPYGKFFEVYGPDSSGKTLLAMRAAAQALRICRECVTPILEFIDYETGETAKTCRCSKQSNMNVIYADPENKADHAWGQVNGWPRKGDPLEKHFRVGSPSSADFLSDMTRIAIKSKVLDFFVADSWAALFPESREGRTAMEQQPGDHAKAIQNLLNGILHENIKNQNEGAFNKTTILGINQIRSKIGGYGNPETTPGGWFLKYIDSGKGRMLSPKTNEGIQADKMTGQGEHYVDFNFKLEKAAFGVGKGSVAGWRVYNRKYGDNVPGGTNEPKRMQDDLKRLGIHRKEKNSHFLLGIKFDNATNMVKALETPAMQWAIRFASMFKGSTPETKAYIDIERFDYNPFYRFQVDEPVDKGEGIVTQEITLVRRESPTKGSVRKRRTRKPDVVKATVKKSLSELGTPVPEGDE